MRHKLTKQERELARRVTNIGVRSRQYLRKCTGETSSSVFFVGYMSAVRSMIFELQVMRLLNRRHTAQRRLARLFKPGRFVRRTRKVFVPDSPSHKSPSSH